MSKSILDTAEVIHDYMRNGDRSTSREECITWIAQLIQEVSQQAPSADRYEQYKKNPYYPFESESQWLEYDNQLINKTREKDKAPSATVDEKIKAIAQRLAQHVTFDRKEAIVSGCIKVGYTNHNVAELIEEGITEYLRSQQPTVDVDALFTKYAVFIHDRDGIPKKNVSALIQEALRGSYKRSDMIAFGMDCCSNWDDNGIIDAKLTQYDTERGK